ncbi:MAG: hypothetical protein AVDCRST_MAG11-2647, partial [uncultured Gemmatimonadaceae bacterium]
ADLGGDRDVRRRRGAARRRAAARRRRDGRAARAGTRGARPRDHGEHAGGPLVERRRDRVQHVRDRAADPRPAGVGAAV